MALSVKVGSITAPAGTGNQSYTGIGFQPKVVIFFGNGATADGMGGSVSSDSTMPIYLGFGVGSTYGVLDDNDDFTSGDPSERNSACIAQQYSNSNNRNWHIKASMVSLDADGFTLNWANTTSGIVVNYLALGGTELSASVVHPTVRTTTGSWAITGAGFQPDAAIVLLGTNGDTPTDLLGGFGFVSKQGTTVKQGTGTTSYDGGSAVYQRTDQTIALVDGGFGKVYEASHTSMDTDGMTLNVTTVTGGASLISSILFLKGVQIRSDAFAQKTSTGTQAYTGYGFTPKALLFGGMHKTAGTTVVSDGVPWMFGATDGTNRGVVAKISNNNGVHALDRTKVYKWPSDSSSPTVVAAADLSTFDSDGFTLNYTTADATARQTLVMAFGDPAGGATTNQAMTANVALTSSLVRQVNKGLTGNVAATPTLVKQVNKPLSVTVTTTSTLVAAKQKVVTMLANLVTTASLSRRVNKALSGNVVTTSTLSRLVSKILSGNVAATPTLTKRVNKPLSTTVTTTASLVAFKAFIVNMLSTVTTTASLSRVVQKPLSVTVSIAPSLSKQISKALSVNVPITPSMAKQINKVLNTNVTTTATLTHVLTAIPMLMVATVTTTATLVKQIRKPMLANVSTTATLGKVRPLAMSAIVTTTATLGHAFRAGTAVAVRARNITFKRFGFY